MTLSRESYSLTPGMTRPRTQSQVTPGRRQRKISQTNRKLSHSTLTRKRRESRHAMQPAVKKVSHDEHLDVVQELGTNNEDQGYFDKVGYSGIHVGYISVLKSSSDHKI